MYELRYKHSYSYICAYKNSYACICVIGNYKGNCSIIWQLVCISFLYFQILQINLYSVVTFSFLTSCFHFLKFNKGDSPAWSPYWLVLTPLLFKKNFYRHVMFYWLPQHLPWHKSCVLKTNHCVFSSSIIVDVELLMKATLIWICCLCPSKILCLHFMFSSIIICLFKNKFPSIQMMHSRLDSFFLHLSTQRPQSPGVARVHDWAAVESKSPFKNESYN